MDGEKSAESQQCYLEELAYEARFEWRTAFCLHQPYSWAYWFTQTFFLHNLTLPYYRGVLIYRALILKSVTKTQWLLLTNKNAFSSLSTVYRFRPLHPKPTFLIQPPPCKGSMATSQYAWAWNKDTISPKSTTLEPYSSTERDSGKDASSSGLPEPEARNTRVGFTPQHLCSTRTSKYVGGWTERIW